MFNDIGVRTEEVCAFSGGESRQARSGDPGTTEVYVISQSHRAGVKISPKRHPPTP